MSFLHWIGSQNSDGSDSRKVQTSRKTKLSGKIRYSTFFLENPILNKKHFPTLSKTFQGKKSNHVLKVLARVNQSHVMPNWPGLPSQRLNRDPKLKTVDQNAMPTRVTRLGEWFQRGSKILPRLKLTTSAQSFFLGSEFLPRLKLST